MKILKAFFVPNNKGKRCSFPKTERNVVRLVCNHLGKNFGQHDSGFGRLDCKPSGGTVKRNPMLVTPGATVLVSAVKKVWACLDYNF